MADDDEIARLLHALVAIDTERLLRDHPSLGASRFTSIEAVLLSAGLKNVEIAEVLGKSPQAVSQALARARARPRTSAS